MTAPPNEPAPAPSAPRNAAAWRRRRRLRRAVTALRGAGAVALWGGAQAVAILPPPLVGAALGLIVGAGFVWWYVLRRGYPGELRRRATLRLRRPLPVLGWLPALIALSSTFALASSIVVARFVAPPRIPEWFERLTQRPFGWLALLVAAAVLAPMFEEFLFRGWMQRTLERRWPAVQAIVVTAVVFAAVHGAEPFGFASRLVVGLTLGYVAYASRSIAPSVLLHAGYNATLILSGGVIKGADAAALVRWAHMPRVLVPAALVSLLAGLGLVWVLRRMGEQAAAARVGRRAGPARDVPGVALGGA